jgi:hypothetical protein
VERTHWRGLFQPPRASNTSLRSMRSAPRVPLTLLHTSGLFTTLVAPLTFHPESEQRLGRICSGRPNSGEFRTLCVLLVPAQLRLFSGCERSAGPSILRCLGGSTATVTHRAMVGNHDGSRASLLRTGIGCSCRRSLALGMFLLKATPAASIADATPHDGAIPNNLSVHVPSPR